MLGKVHEWKMTEEERLAYIAKNPIIQIDRPKGSQYGMTEEEFNDRSKKAREKRWGNRDHY